MTTLERWETVDDDDAAAAAAADDDDDDDDLSFELVSQVSQFLTIL